MQLQCRGEFNDGPRPRHVHLRVLLWGQLLSFVPPNFYRGEEVFMGDVLLEECQLCTNLILQSLSYDLVLSMLSRKPIERRASSLSAVSGDFFPSSFARQQAFCRWHQLYNEGFRLCFTFNVPHSSKYSFSSDNLLCQRSSAALLICWPRSNANPIDSSICSRDSVM